MAIDTYSPGMRVRVTQSVPRLDRQSGDGGGTMSSTIEGAVQKFEQQKTGSWFAHAKDHKLWIDRLVLKADDGEIIYVNLDQYTHVDVLADAPKP
jgi:hypothetical protein